MTNAEKIKQAYNSKKPIHLTARHVRLLSKGKKIFVMDCGIGYELIAPPKLPALFDAKGKRISEKRLHYILKAL